MMEASERKSFLCLAEELGCVSRGERGKAERGGREEEGERERGGGGRGREGEAERGGGGERGGGRERGEGRERERGRETDKGIGWRGERGGGGEREREKGGAERWGERVILLSNPFLPGGQFEHVYLECLDGNRHILP